MLILYWGKKAFIKNIQPKWKNVRHPCLKLGAEIYIQASKGEFFKRA